MNSVRFGAAFLLLAMSGVIGLKTAANDEAGSLVRRALRSASGSVGQTSVGFVTADVLGGRIALHDLRIRGSETDIRIGALTLPTTLGARFWFMSSAEAASTDGKASPPLANATATADNVVATSGGVTYTIKHIEMKGTALSNADIVALLDPKSAETIEARLRKLSADSIVASEILTDWKVGDFEQVSTQKNVLLANVVAGTIGQGSIATVTVATKTKDRAINTEATGLEVKKLDLAQIAQAVLTVRHDDSEPLRSVFDSISVAALSSANLPQNQKVSSAYVVLTGGRMRALQNRLQDTPAKLAGRASDSPETRSFLADLSGSIEIGHAEAATVAFSQPVSTTQAAADYSARSISFDGLARNHLAAAALRGLNMNDPGVHITVASAHAADIILPLPSNGARAETPLPLIGKIDVSQLAFDRFEQTGADGQGKSPFHLALEHAAFEAGGLTPGVMPPTASFVFDHAVFDASPKEDATKMVALLGYKQVDLSGNLTSRYDSKTQSLSIDKLALEGKQMGRLEVKLDLANVGNGVASANPDVQKASAIAMLFKGIVLDLRNDGLFERSLDFKAKMDGTSVAEEKEKGVSMASVMLPAMMNNDPKLKTLGDAVARFIENPKTLHVSIQATRGIGFADAGVMMNNPSVLLDVLDVQAKAD